MWTVATELLSSALGYLDVDAVLAAKDGFDHVGRMLTKLLRNGR